MTLRVQVKAKGGGGPLGFFYGSQAIPRGRRPAWDASFSERVGKSRGTPDCVSDGRFKGSARRARLANEQGERSREAVPPFSRRPPERRAVSAKVCQASFSLAGSP